MFLAIPRYTALQYPNCFFTIKNGCSTQALVDVLLELKHTITLIQKLDVEIEEIEVEIKSSWIKSIPRFYSAPTFFRCGML